MSSLWHNKLREAWIELAQHPVQSRQFRSRRLSEHLTIDAYAALRAVDGAPCLLIEATPPGDAHFEVGGMRLGMVGDDRGPLIVLSLEDRDRIDLFTTVCADAISASDTDRDNALTQFLSRLDAWRRFLRERRSGLSREETIGLLGELLILVDLLAVNPTATDVWESPNDGLHDFLCHGHALEVKTSLGSSSSVHIATLDQLEITGLRRLDVLHVRLIEAPDGTSLEGIISQITGLLENDPSRRTFENALLRRGLMPDDISARSALRIQLRAVDAYNVGSDFPRLERAAVPQAVSDAQYTLELRALSDFVVSTASVLKLFNEGGAT